MDQDAKKKEELLIATLYGMLSGQFKLVGIINQIHASMANEMGLPEGQATRMESALEDMNASLTRLNELAEVAGMLARKDKPQ